ncbi:MAG: MBL fold metallo-hydrolase [Pseudomonadales bacterium]|nr:MBL fold metallo-hydrolase [Pseudomonadales bacterium]MCP5214006.1 MBL fold metallo-hydrolase [Pseudomonadales bacterium]MCP5302787.1 MBL fold metallo-hydrolase [Pseudomonadales bacterium]
MNTDSAETHFIRKTFPVGPLQCNCSIIGDKLTQKAIIIDPGGDAQKIMDEVKALGMKIIAIIHTHAHLDHILAAGEIKKATGAPLYLHKGDKFLWDALESQCHSFGVPYQPVPDPDQWLNDDQDLHCCGGVTLHTPGHTPGSMSYWFADQKLLIAGDTLFRRSIGRTDFPGGDFATIMRSIRERLMILDEDTTVITGHGPATTIGEELRENPFINQ